MRREYMDSELMANEQDDVQSKMVKGIEDV